MGDNPPDPSANFRSWLAVLISLAALVASPLIGQAIGRTESIRAERRAAYASFLGDVERCGGLAEQRALNTSLTASLQASEMTIRNIRDRLQREPTPDEHVNRLVEAQRVLTELRVQLLEADSECTEAVARSAGVILLLADDTNLTLAAVNLKSAVFRLRLEASEVAYELTEGISQVGLVEPPPPSTTPATASTPSTNSMPTSSASPPSTQPSAPVSCDPSQDVPGQLDPCYEAYNEAYLQFQTAAVADIQAETAIEEVWRWAVRGASVVGFVGVLALVAYFARSVGRFRGRPPKP